MPGIRGIRLHHLARQNRRTEQEYIRVFKELPGTTHIFLSAVQHLSDMADIIDDQPFAGNRGFNREGRILE